MRKTFRQTFPHSLEKLLAAREDRRRNLKDNPEYKHVEVLEDEERDGKRYRKTMILVDSDLPAVLRKFVPDGLTRIRDDSEFDLVEHSHRFTIYMPDYEKAFLLKGSSVYGSIGHSESYREYDIHVTSKAPFVGPVIERAIWSFHERNLEKDRNSLLEFIAGQVG